MKSLQCIVTATSLFILLSVGATIKTIDTDSFGKTIFIDTETKEVIFLNDLTGSVARGFIFCFLLNQDYIQYIDSAHYS